jgi:hypothetical protein
VQHLSCLHAQIDRSVKQLSSRPTPTDFKGFYINYRELLEHCYFFGFNVFKEIPISLFWEL